MELAKAELYFERDRAHPVMAELLVHFKIEIEGRFNGYISIPDDAGKPKDNNLSGSYFLKLNDGRCGVIQISSSRLKRGDQSVVEFKSIGTISKGSVL